jgi:hypothetical protein
MVRLVVQDRDSRSTCQPFLNDHLSHRQKPSRSRLIAHAPSNERLAGQPCFGRPIRPSVVIEMQHEVSNFGFPHDCVSVSASPVSGRAPKTRAEFPAGASVSMFTLCELDPDIIVVAERFHRVPPRQRIEIERARHEVEILKTSLARTRQSPTGRHQCQYGPMFHSRWHNPASGGSIACGDGVGDESPRYRCSHS